MSGRLQQNGLFLIYFICWWKSIRHEIFCLRWFIEMVGGVYLRGRPISLAETSLLLSTHCIRSHFCHLTKNNSESGDVLSLFDAHLHFWFSVHTCPPTTILTTTIADIPNTIVLFFPQRHQKEQKISKLYIKANQTLLSGWNCARRSETGQCSLVSRRGGRGFFNICCL